MDIWPLWKSWSMVHALRIHGTGLFAYFKPKWATKENKLGYFPLNPGCSIAILISLISWFMNQSPQNWVGFHPLHTLLFFFHCSNVGKYIPLIQPLSRIPVAKKRGFIGITRLLNMVHNPGADDCLLDGGPISWWLIELQNKKLLLSIILVGL